MERPMHLFILNLTGVSLNGFAIKLIIFAFGNQA